MNCDDYLAMLETLPVNELAHGEARGHAAICHDCNRVTRVVAERERNMLMAYGDVMPMAAASDVAATAVGVARRRRVASWYRAGLAAAAVVAIGVIGASRLAPARVARRSMGIERQQFVLRCASADAAADLLRARLDDPEHLYVRVPPSMRVVIVEGDAGLRGRAASLIDEYESQCRLQQAR